jgi:Domain of unknown function (DUF4062)
MTGKISKMEKRYQVFISSTFEDLKEERTEVVQALLELDCIPCGMEYFPASNDNQWDFIKRLIDDCDYYIVIVGGRYGSIDSNGISYTQKEYDYAVSKGIPVIAFLHSDPGNIVASKVEKDSKKRKKLEDFREMLRGRLCKMWSSAKDLGGVVSRSMVQEIKKNPRVGWIKADTIDVNTEKTILSLYKKIQELEESLTAKTKNRIDFKTYFEDTKELSQGEDMISVTYVTTKGPWTKQRKMTAVKQFTWNQITFKSFPRLINPIRESAFKKVLSDCIFDLIDRDEDDMKTNLSSNMISEESFQTIKIQLLSLGYIEIFMEGDDKEKLFRKVRLTEIGEQILIRQRAVKRTEK